MTARHIPTLEQRQARQERSVRARAATEQMHRDAAERDREAFLHPSMVNSLISDESVIRLADEVVDLAIQDLRTETHGIKVDAALYLLFGLWTPEDMWGSITTRSQVGVYRQVQKLAAERPAVARAVREARRLGGGLDAEDAS
jgi:hypothetical protein